MGLLQDESLAVIREQFDRKADWLRSFGSEVPVEQLYAAIYGDLDLVLPVVILDEDNEERTQHILPMPLNLAILEAESRNDLLLGGTVYYNNFISKKTAHDIRAFIVDVDNVYEGVLGSMLQSNWVKFDGTPIPKPTYVVNSGTGLHLYYVLKEPLPHYRRQWQEIDQLYRTLAIKNGERYFVRPQVQWFGQNFRMVGGLNKYGWTNVAYEIGEKWDVNELAQALGLDITLDGYDTKSQKAEEERVQQRLKRKHKSIRKSWAKPGLYTTSLENCRTKTKVGNRYMSFCGLAVCGWKAKIPLEQIEKDCYELLEIYNTKYPIVKEREISNALRMYNEKALYVTRETLERFFGWQYDPIPRNGRKQYNHLHDEFIFVDGKKKKNPCRDNRLLNAGAANKQQLVQDYAAAHPGESQRKIAAALGISPTTVNKWLKKN